ncbi:hypothetical protein BASA81_002387 [Batrachochytrium salamandrivorans]|nr:hypothetical protein BASA81_002387 [Batrachochytrium salamandrivorans]
MAALARAGPSETYCPDSESACHGSQICHWNGVLSRCVSSVPCALELVPTSCLQNTFGCEWSNSRCAKLERRTPTVESPCLAHKYDQAGCATEKRCFWQSFTCQLRPTIVLSLADDLGWNDVGWNNPRARTPVLDGLRAQGINLNRHYVARFCAPSRAMIMTGKYAWRMGLQTDLNLNPVWNLRCASDAGGKLLPQVLKETGGYATLGFGKWHLGHYRDDLIPTSRGFDQWIGYYGGGIERNTRPNQFYSQRCACQKSNTCATYSSGTSMVCATATGMVNCTAGEPQRIVDSVNVELEETTDVFLANRAREAILSAREDVPLFLFLSWSTPHDPVYAPSSFKSSILYSRPQFGTDAPINKVCKSDKRLEHLAMVTTLDAAHAAVIDSLEEVNRFDTTVFVFMSDNGGNSPWRKAVNVVSTCAAGSNYPLRGAKFTWWEGGVRALGFVYSRNYMVATKRGRSFQQLISAADWRRTLVKASGTAWPKDLDDDGVDYWSPLSGLGVPSYETRTELPLQVWKEQSRHVHLFYYPNSAGGPELHKLIIGNPFSGWGSGNVGTHVAKYSHGEIDQPPELPNSEVKFSLDNGFNAKLQCASSCLYNLDRDQQELLDLSTTRPDLLKIAMVLVEKYKEQYVQVRSSGLCDAGFYATDNKDTMDANSIYQARRCGGWVPWLHTNSTLKTTCQ